MKKERPLGVTILAILGYIGTVLLAIGGILMFTGAGFLTTSFGTLGVFSSNVFIGMGVFFLAFAVLQFFIAKGLWDGKNWARIITIVFAAIGVLSALMSLISGSFSSIISLAIDGVIIWYLATVGEVKRFFGA